MLLREIAVLDEVLHAHASALGRDFTAYHNHTYRVANLCLALTARDADTIHRIAVAAAFHDIGIWTAGTFDYLEPSVTAATLYLNRANRSARAPEIAAMIREHHKILPYRDRPDSLVEPFRKADWIDVSRGVLSFGLNRAFLAEVLMTWPDDGFHRRLLQLSLGRFRTHPWSPLPMFRL